MSTTDNLVVGGQALSPGKRKIVDCAVTLFATKGVTETSIREIATAVGIQGSAIYHHFASKNAILEYILNDFSEQSFGDAEKSDALSKLRNNPTSDGIISCMRLTFPEGQEEYYMKVLCVVLQEQHRNPSVRRFVIKLILNAEERVRDFIGILKELNIIRQDTEPDLWMKLVSSVLYTYSSRVLLGIGDVSPDYVGMKMSELLRVTYDQMLNTCAIMRDEES